MSSLGTQVERVRLPVVEGLTVRSSAPHTIELVGSIALRDPKAELGSWCAAVHAAAVADGVAGLRIDVRELGFVNSSALRLFIDWATLVRAEPEARRYRLHFVSDPHVTWQKTALGALTSLLPDVVAVETT
jgi:hypothetical protein